MSKTLLCIDVFAFFSYPESILSIPSIIFFLVLAFCFAVGPLPPPFALYDATAPAIALAAFSDLP